VKSNKELEVMAKTAECEKGEIGRSTDGPKRKRQTTFDHPAMGVYTPQAWGAPKRPHQASAD